MPPEMAHLCVIRSYGEWIAATGIADGYVFQKIDQYDQVVHLNEATVCGLQPDLSLWYSP